MDVPCIEERLSRLERQNKWLRRLLLAALAIAAGGALLAAGSRVHADSPAWQRTVEAEKFVLRGADGKMHAELSVADNVPRLALFDAAGKQRATLVVGSEGPALTLYDTSGMQRAKLAVDSEGPYLGLNSPTGRPHVWLTNAKDGPSITLLDSHGFESVFGDISLPSPKTGKLVPSPAASIHLFNAGGHVIWTAP